MARYATRTCRRRQRLQFQLLPPQTASKRSSIVGLGNSGTPEEIEMRHFSTSTIVGGAATTVIAILFVSAIQAACQAHAAPPQVYRAPRTPYGTPNLNGIWQANNTANWDLQAHAASQ